MTARMRREARQTADGLLFCNAEEQAHIIEQTARHWRVTTERAWQIIQRAHDEETARDIVAKETTEERSLIETPAAPGNLF